MRREILRRNVKEIINEKSFKILCIILIAFLIVMAITFNAYEILFITLCAIILFFIFFYKILFGINIINLDKIKKWYLYRKYKKNVENDELYCKNLNIHTFDGTGELTHPSVIYFENGFMGYKYWMVHTPYHNCRLCLENPSLVVSNDGVNFEKLENVKDPLLEIIDCNNPKTYYNDPNLIYTDKLEIWYRYTIEYDDKENDHFVYRITSSDGRNWSKPEIILTDKAEKMCYMSISLIYECNEYKLYYFNKNNIYVRKSKDLICWSAPELIRIENYKGDLWHGEVKKYDNTYYILFIDRKYGLFMAESKDGLVYGKTKKINFICDSKDYFYVKNVLYKSSFIIKDDYILFYVPFRFDNVRLFKVNEVMNNRWYITISKIRRKNLDKYVMYV